MNPHRTSSSLEQTSLEEENTRLHQLVLLLQSDIQRKDAEIVKLNKFNRAYIKMTIQLYEKVARLEHEEISIEGRTVTVTRKEISESPKASIWPPMKEVFNAEYRGHASSANAFQQPATISHIPPENINNAQMSLYTDEDVPMSEASSWEPMRRALAEIESSINPASRHEHSGEKPPEYSPSDTVPHAEPASGGRESERPETPETEEVGDTTDNDSSGDQAMVRRPKGRLTLAQLKAELKSRGWTEDDFMKVKSFVEGSAEVVLDMSKSLTKQPEGRVEELQAKVINAFPNLELDLHEDNWCIRFLIQFALKRKKHN